MPNEIKPSGDGRPEFTDGPVTPAGKAEGDAGGAAPAEGGGLQLAPPVKGLIIGVLTDAMDRLMSIVNKVQAAGSPADAAPGDLTIPDEVGIALVDVQDRIAAFMKQYKVGKAVVEKLSKDRVARFEKTFALLDELLKELSPLIPTPAQARAAAGPVAAKPAAPAATPAAKAAAAPAASPELTALRAEVAKMADANAKMAAEMAQLRRFSPPSNAGQPEGGSRQPAAKAGESAWPMDMNRPLDRAKVDKSVSFYED